MMRIIVAHFVKLSACQLMANGSALQCLCNISLIWRFFWLGCICMESSAIRLMANGSCLLLAVSFSLNLRLWTLGVFFLAKDALNLPHLHNEFYLRGMGEDAFMYAFVRSYLFGNCPPGAHFLKWSYAHFNTCFFLNGFALFHKCEYIRLYIRIRRMRFSIFLIQLFTMCLKE